MAKLYIITGPDKNQSFELKDDPIYIGRSPGTDIQVRDRFVSRRHLIISRKGDTYFIKDLNTKNGTFINGEQIRPDVDIELKEGLPIVIGMSVIGLGEACLEGVLPFLDYMNSSEALGESGKVVVRDRTMTYKKNMELISKVSEILTQSLSIDDTLKQILDYILDLLKRTDRGAIILVDSETGEFLKVMSKFKKNLHDDIMSYSREVVDEVTRDQRPVIITDVQAKDEGDLADTLKLSKIGSVMCVPLISRSQIRGVIYVDSVNKPYGFREEDLSLLTALSGQLAVAIEMASLYSKENGVIQAED